ncbi:MAG: hypothetical protein C4575_12850 [Desulforudis sp.]|jgi:hypothetical protein|nr:MAG: hypothetical protein C4575_12850 [Desulforudis sp.]
MNTKQIDRTEIKHYRHLKHSLYAGCIITLENGDEAMIIRPLNTQRSKFLVELIEPKEFDLAEFLEGGQ